jgi:type IV pilus assembly protein PilQ
MLRILMLAAVALAMAVPAQGQSAASACRDGGSRCISVSFDDVEVAEVAAAFAEFTGTSIMLAGGVGAQRVTAEIRNQPWDVALRAILQSQGLGVRQIAPGLLRVDALARLAGQEEAAPLVTRVFRLNYAQAASMANTLDAVKSPRGRIAVNADTNALIVTDTEEAVATMERLIGHP